MHEGALTKDLFDHVLIHAKEAGARHVTQVKVTIGELSDATPESIEFYFNSLAPGTLADGAVLEFSTATATAQCKDCGKDVPVDDLYAPCPECGAFPLSIKITGGNGVYLSSLEIETGDGQHEQIQE
jgi:hydrogenase nickel incorporation protein HypA/HybF